MSALLFLLAPLFSGSLKWLKARLTYRQGPSPWQDYPALARLWPKVWIWPESASPVFLLGPVAAFASALVALGLLPFLPTWSFAGDFLVLLALLGLGRFFQVLAALDPGSAFGGQGAYRESQVSVLAEPGTLMGLSALVLASGGLSLAEIRPMTSENLLVYAFALVALALGLLAENARMPIDDPTTHLELTMIHEAQLLDHSGPLLLLYELAAKTKLLVYIGLMALPLPFSPWANLLLAAGIALFSLALLETFGVKLRYLRLPDLLSYSTLAGLLALLGVVLWR